MIPTTAAIKAVHRRYAQNDVVYKLVLEHCEIVAEIAAWCAEQKQLAVNVLMGLSKPEIIDGHFGMPQNDYFPATLEARLLCYADRFHSKLPTFNAYEPFVERLERDLPEQAHKLKQSAEEFGIPDVPALAKKYGHPVR